MPAGAASALPLIDGIRGVAEGNEEGVVPLSAPSTGAGDGSAAGELGRCRITNDRAASAPRLRFNPTGNGVIEEQQRSTWQATNLLDTCLQDGPVVDIALAPSTVLTSDVKAGDQRLPVAETGPSPDGFQVGDTVVVDPGTPNAETAVVTGFGSFLLALPLTRPHPSGTPIFFVRANEATPVDNPVVPIATSTTTTIVSTTTSTVVPTTSTTVAPTTSSTTTTIAPTTTSTTTSTVPVSPFVVVAGPTTTTTTSPSTTTASVVTAAATPASVTTASTASPPSTTSTTPTTPPVSVLGVQVTQPTARPAPARDVSELAFTGSRQSPVVPIGLVLLTTGGVLLAAARRRRQRRAE